MSTEESTKKPEAADSMESEMEDRDENRRQDERAERQDLNQGMETGTHDSARFGVKWGRSYRVPSKPVGPNKARKEEDKSIDGREK
jgi:hypothetical protein